MATESITRQCLNRFFDIDAYGVRVRLGSNSELIENAIRDMLRRLYGERLTVLEAENTDAFELYFGIAEADGKYFYFENDKPAGSLENLDDLIGYLDAHLRIAVGEHAKQHVFIHAGVVGIGGRAVVVPGFSRSGKTTLVKELIKNGADYFSDEYAVIDAAGLCHPFPRALGIRGQIKGSERQIDVSPTTLGASIGDRPLPVGLLLITEFRPDAVWEPVFPTVGEAMLEVMPHTISIGRNTHFAMNALKNMLGSAIIAKSSRGDAVKFTQAILNFIDTKCNFSLK